MTHIAIKNHRKIYYTFTTFSVFTIFPSIYSLVDQIQKIFTIINIIINQYLLSILNNQNKPVRRNPR